MATQLPLHVCGANDSFICIAGARWDAPTVGKNEAHLWCMKNEAGLRPMKRGFAARRIHEYASLYVRPVSELHLKVKRFSPLSRAEFHLAEVKFRWVFGKGLKKGCLQTFEELSQKDTIVLPQAKCRETSLYCHSLSTNSLKGSGNFLLRKFPVSPVLPFICAKVSLAGG